MLMITRHFISLIFLNYAIILNSYYFEYINYLIDN